MQSTETNHSSNGNTAKHSIVRESLLADPATNNVDAIAKLEREALDRLSFIERVGDTITSRIGTMAGILIHLALIIAWCVINLRIIPGVPAFDPYPFGLLTLIMSLEGVLVAMLVLATQNRMSQRSERRSHLDLQIDILAEQEMTRVLHMLKALCDHQGLRIESHEKEVERLMESTDVRRLIADLDEKLPTT